MSQVKFVVERVGRQVKITAFNTPEAAKAWRQLWDGIGFCEWGKAHLALPKRTIVSDSYGGSPIKLSFDEYELSLGALYNLLANPSATHKCEANVIECNSVLHAEKVFHDVSRILDDVMRQIAVAVRDMSQGASETRTIEVNF